jgi:hypothetical protein
MQSGYRADRTDTDELIMSKIKYPIFVNLFGNKFLLPT